MRRHRQKKHSAFEVFPELEPAEPAPRGMAGRLSLDDGIAEVRAQFAELMEDPEARNPLSRVMVYALNAVLLILAFPVGFALLIFNVLGGESLRTTAHVLALTGLAMAITTTETGARILGLG